MQKSPFRADRNYLLSCRIFRKADQVEDCNLRLSGCRTEEPEADRLDGSVEKFGLGFTRRCCGLRRARSWLWANPVGHQTGFHLSRYVPHLSGTWFHATDLISRSKLVD